MGILVWIMFGLIAGAVAKLVMPERDPGGIIVTIVLGIVGAVVSDFLGAFFGFGTVTDFDARRMRIAIGGALILPFGYRLFAVRALA